MRIFVINLDRQPERLQRMAKILDQLGLEFTRVGAVDGLQLSTKEAGSKGSLRAGETACFLSHRKCWQSLVDEGLPYATVFEDDLHLSADAASLLRSGAWIPSDADVVKVETKLYPTRVDKTAAAIVGGRKLHRLRSRHGGTGGYIVTRKAAKMLLAMSERFDASVDQFIFNPELSSAASLVTYQLLPALCIQDFVVKEPAVVLGLGSELHDERSLSKPKGMKKLWREVKRPFAQFAGFVHRKLSTLLTDKQWVVVELQ